MAERLTTGEICTRSVTIAFRRTTLNGWRGSIVAEELGLLVVAIDSEGKRERQQRK